jgi:chemotaxis protein methyltransferase CheR
MVISNFFEHHPAKSRDFLIIATDISTRVLDIAKRGIYSEEKIEPVPQELKKAYFMRSVDRNRRLVRIAPELRSKLRFRRLNLMDEDFGFREHIDIIFCRNVIIYFDKPTQERLLNKYHRHLTDGGHLFLGHSETIQGLNVPFVQVAPTIYKKV